MGRAIEAVGIALFSFIAIRELTTHVITGSDAGSIVLQNLAALAVAVGVVLAALLGIARFRKRVQE